MTFEKLTLDWALQKRLNVFLGALLILSLIALLALSVALARAERTVVLVPPEVTTTMEIRRGSADKDTLQAWGQFAAHALGNVTPANIDMTRTTLEPLLDASIYDEVIGRLEAEMDNIFKERRTVSFEPHSVAVDEVNGRVWVTGMSVVTSLVGAEVRHQRTFEVEMRISGYHPRITWIGTYEGAPRTAEIGERG